jgi:hypothetical protein
MDGRALGTALLCVLLAGWVVGSPTPVQARETVSRSIPELLRIVEAKSGTTDPALVRVTLRNGVRFEGMVSSYDTREGVCVLSASDGQTSVIEVGEIVAVTILRPGAAKIALQGGRIYREEGDDAPSFLAMKRRATELSKQYKANVELVIPDQENENLDCRFATHRLLGALEATLKDVTVDTMGQQGLARYRSGIRLTHQSGASQEALATGQSITVRFDCRAPLTQGYDADLAEGIRKLL